MVHDGAPDEIGSRHRPGRADFRGGRPESDDPVGRLSNEEESKGSIRPGKRADFVVLDKDPLTIAPEEIRTIKVIRTVKDGSTVYIAGTAAP